MKKKVLALMFAVTALVCFSLVSCGNDADTTYPVEFIISDATAKAGESVTVEISVNSTTEANAVLLYQLEYDESILEFVSFANLGEAASESIFGEQGLDEKTGTVSISLLSSEKLTGKVCDVTFKVKDGAKSGAVKVSMRSVVKNNQTEIQSAVQAGTITVSP